MIRFLPRSLRVRLSAASRPVSLRPSKPWYVGVGVVALALALGLIAGRWSALGWTQSAQAQVREIQALRERVAASETELSRLRSLANSGESRVQVERSAQQQLARQVQALEEENGRLKEELAVFDSLVPGASDRPVIHRLRVEAMEEAGEYRYRLLLIAGGTRDPREFNGSLQLVVSVVREGRNAVMTLPDTSARDERYRLSFRRMQRVEGTFRVDPAAKVKSVQVRVLENGVREPRAVSSAILS